MDTTALLAALDEVRITDELWSRRFRGQDPDLERRALYELMHAFSRTPHAVLHHTTQAALQLSGAASAGISLPEIGTEGAILRWVALAGTLAPLRGGCSPRNFSPCGVCLDLGAPQLFRRPARYFTELAVADPPIAEALVLPIHAGGDAIGTLWLVSHDDAFGFDAEDVRRLQPVCDAAAAAHQMMRLAQGEAEGRMRAEAALAGLGRTERALRASESEFRAFFDAAGVGTVLANPVSGRLLRVNAKFCEMTGYTAEELLGKTFLDITHPDDRESNRRSVGRFVAGDVRQYEVEKRYVRKDGGVIWAHLTAALVSDDSGLPLRSAAIVEDVTERRRIERTLRRLVDSNVVAIVVADADGVLEANDAFLRLAGRTREELAAGALSWRAMTPAEYRDLDERGLAQLRTDGTCAPYEKEIVRSDGLRVPILIGAATIDGAPLRWVCFIADLTERKRAEAERDALLAVAQAATARAERASRAKDEFLATLAHELRNPLAAVRNAVFVARTDDARRPAALDIAHRQAGQLGRLVDDLLDVARIARGRIVLRTERVRLPSVLDAALATVQPVVDERRHAVAVHVAAPAIEVEGDVVRLEQVVTNLLVNAARYTEPGGRIEVALGVEGGEAVLRVRDNGAGLPADLLPVLFEPFTQGARTLDRGQGGLGIGLSVVRRLVELHRGTVTAESEGPGTGATFVVRLPLAAAPAATEAAVPPAEPEPVRPARVLIAEDNRDVAAAVAMLLEVLGHEVTVVYDAAATLEAAAMRPPDVAIVDIGLPDMDGYELARRLRATAAGARTVLVALTGYGRAEDRQRALAAGFDYHLTKPTEPDQIQAIVASHAGRRRETSRTLH